MALSPSEGVEQSPGEVTYAEASEPGDELRSRRMISDQEIRDTAAKFALSGGDPSVLAETVSAMCESRKLSASLWFQAQRAKLSARVGELETRRQEAEGIQNRESALQAELLQVTGAAQVLERDLATLISEIRAARFNELSRHIEVETQRLKRESRPIDLEETENDFLLAKRVHELEKEAHGLNDGELSRQANGLEDEKKKIEEELDLAKSRMKLLHEMGVTRTAAGFLTWAGYLSIGGIALVISGLLQARSFSQQFDPLSFAWTLMGAMSHGTNSSLVFGLFPPLLVKTTVAFVVLGLLFVLFDRVYGKIGPAYRRSKGRKGRNSRESLSELLSFPYPQVRRGHFVQLLGAIPYILVVITFLTLFSPQELDLASSVGKSFTVSLATSYIGVCYVLMATCAALLYSMHVIELRAQKLPKQEGALPHAASFRFKWEIYLLFGLGILSLAVLALVPDGAEGADAVYKERLAWASISIFFVLATLCIAYGLYYKGRFKDVEVLTSLRNAYSQRIDELRGAPLFQFVAPSLVEDQGKGDRHSTSLRDKLDEFRVLYGVQSFFADEADYSILYRLWRLRTGELTSWSKRMTSAEGAQEQGIKIADYKVAPEKVTEIRLKKEMVRQSHQRTDEIRATLGVLQERLGALKRDDLDREIASLQGEIESLKLQEASAIAEVDFVAARKNLEIYKGFATAAVVAENSRPIQSIKPEEASGTSKEGLN